MFYAAFPGCRCLLFIFFFFGIFLLVALADKKVFPSVAVVAAVAIIIVGTFC